MRRFYILNIEELHQVARQEMILAGLNLKRREKALKCGREEDRLRSMAAGALLQYGIWRWQQEQVPLLEPMSQGLKLTEPLPPETDGSIWEPVTWEHLEACFQAFAPSLTFREGPHGKPYLEDLPVHFNLSHSGSMVLCGISDSQIGVDIQKKEPGNHERLWKRYFSDKEKELLSLCQSLEEQEELFYRLWTQKEAYGKLTGEGLSGASGLTASPLLEREKLGICLEERTPVPGYCAAACWYA